MTIKKLSAICALLLCLVLIICMTSSDAQKTIKECKGGREFWGCDSPTKECQKLCENKNLRVKKSNGCQKTCFLTCVCVPGFLREGENGECVPENECPGA